MAIINQRWPRELSPETCVFTRARNDIRQEAPLSRRATVIRQGRPLWEAQLSWSLPNTERLAQLRYWLDSLDGFNGSAQIWDFASPLPHGIELATPGGIEPSRVYWTHLGVLSPWTWQGLPAHWVSGATVPLAGTATAGLSAFSVIGLEPNKIAAVQGQYVQLGRRLYVVAATATANAGGFTDIFLTTPLLAGAAAGDPVRFCEAACEMELIEQSFSASASAGTGFVSVAATFRETVTDKI